MTSHLPECPFLASSIFYPDVRTGSSNTRFFFSFVFSVLVVTCPRLPSVKQMRVANFLST